MLWHQNLTSLTECIKSGEYESTSIEMFLVTPCFEDFKRFVRKSNTDGGGSLSSNISSSMVGSQFRGFIATFLRYFSMPLLINMPAFVISSLWFSVVVTFFYTCWIYNYCRWIWCCFECHYLIPVVVQKSYFESISLFAQCERKTVTVSIEIYFH